MSESNTHNESKGILGSVVRQGDLNVPKGYWEKLGDEIHAGIQDAEELEKLAPTLFSLPKSDLLVVPEGYFDDLESQFEVQEVESEFAVPDAYFELQSCRILHETVEKDSRDLTVGDSFFESMEAEILAKTVDQREGKVVDFIRRRNLLVSAIGVAAAVVLAWTFFVAEPEEECVTFACLLEQSEISAIDLLEFEDMDLELLVPVESEGVLEDDELYNYLLDSEVDLEDLYYEFE